MIIVLITLWFSGYNITIDAKEVYNIHSLTECEHRLSFILKEYGTTQGRCSLGDIMEKMHES